MYSVQWNIELTAKIPERQPSNRVNANVALILVHFFVY